ncbi:MAG: YhbY family RNA-binding protein [Burkholderiales bacterium]|nr:YhbY family RNA-binding protein [Burkholderiales bacterium]
MPESLTAKSRYGLRARAHALKPVVWIASSVLTDGVLRELDRALTAHELIKVHAAIDDRNERARLLQALCRQLGAVPVQAIGKMLIAFRPQTRPAQPAASLPQIRAKRVRDARKRPPEKRARSAVSARQADPSPRSRRAPARTKRRVPGRTR